VQSVSTLCYPRRIYAQASNNFLVFINAMQSGELDALVEKITGAKLPPPPGKDVIEVQPVGPRKARD